MTGPRRWTADLALGARLTLTGGREGWTRALLAALGVGLGVALLLVAAALPHVIQSRHDRDSGRDYAVSGEAPLPRAANTELVSPFDTRFRDLSITGLILQPEGPHAPVPPGLTALPAPGQLVASPALARLLASPRGALLRPRLDYPIVGTIGDAGLSGPNEYRFYLGSDRLGADQIQSGTLDRIDHFGDKWTSDKLDPVLMMLVAIILVVLLLPVAVFIAAAVRFGGERRDRRLAALRLVGADRQTAVRVAAGEALLGSLFGVAIGVLLLFATRQFVIPRFTLWGVSVFAPDVRPGLALGALILLAVPVSAVAVSIFALRHVVIEPLGVVRRSGSARRRVWWRLALPVIGLALLLPMLNSVHHTGARPNEYQLVVGTALLLIGVAALLPWLIEAALRHAGAATVSWQLAVRRLQLNSGTSTRAAGGVAVAVAGGIALQMMFGGVQGDYTKSTGQDPTRAQVIVVLTQGVDPATASQAATKFGSTRGVDRVYSLLEASIGWAGSSTRSGGTQDNGTQDNNTQNSGTQNSGQTTDDANEPAGTLILGNCQSLTALAGIDRCTDGDVFIAHQQDVRMGEGPLPAPGQRVTLVSPSSGAGPQWTVPRAARSVTPTQDPNGVSFSGVMATPAAIAAAQLRDPTIEIYLSTDGKPDTLEYIRNTAAAVSPLATVDSLRAMEQDDRLAEVRRGLLIGVVAALLLIGASLLVGILEQLREQRRTLAVLVAFGTRRSTLSWSVLWQTAVPVFLGLILAGITGTGLGSALLAVVGEPMRFNWPAVAAMSGAAAVVVLAVTAISLPLLWRLLRPEGLRTE
ncbi:ABC transporter permease [Rugosimonospora africana]|uniref:Membrane protein n=1 Tax=Rugosimonospora africana TaxID=556532 RepID=A0A8J3QXD9_9ACTN|nr:FtsX-like permease family protein [Rugosimonospora africana]GIH17510.1 membrane protein [Rugosimonospora africana]